MAGSQALEAAIGLVLLFFLLSLVASSAVEIISGLLKKRAADLAKVVERMIGRSTHEGVPSLTATSAYAQLNVGGSHRPSYIPARAFGDAVMEIVAAARKGAADADDLVERLPSGLRARLRPMILNAGGDLVAVRAEIETWFDDTMDRLGGAYKRWSQAVLFAVGLVLAVAVNASAFGVAAKLWRDPVTRATVAEAAARLPAEGRPDPAADLAAVAARVDGLDETGLPLGWGGPSPAGSGLGVVGTFFGWVATALLVMLGAPFWFDLLTRLVSLRAAGRKPERAPADPGSATARLQQVGQPPAVSIEAGVAPGASVSFAAPAEGVRAPLSPEQRFFRALPG